MKKLCLLLVLALLLSACAKQEENHEPSILPGTGEDFLVGMETQDVPNGDPAKTAQPLTEFALALLKENLKEGESVLISPLSVYSALAMTAGGADGETLKQMEQVLGMPISDLNNAFGAFLQGLDESRLKLANSIWFSQKESLTVEDAFLQSCLDYYRADAYQIAMDDSGKKAINDWINEHTDGMIPQMLDKMPAEALVFLVNALAFEDSWAIPYKDHQVRPRLFAGPDGNYYVDMMYSEEDTYLEDAHATGFVKYFDGKRYAFAAILPEEGMTPEAYLSQLDGAGLQAILSGATQQRVDTGMPIFETEYMAELGKNLQTMGMTDAFDMLRADFSKMGTSEDGPLYVGSVLHKTFMQVGPQGAKAGAATVVELEAGSAMPPKEPKTVILDRPFVYLLLDCDTQSPVFIGTMHTPCQREEQGYPEEATDAKPVIYLYPQEPCQVDVKLHYDGTLTHTYPAYENGWSVLAEPDGTLTDLRTGREHYCLFWEGQRQSGYDLSRGFAVEGEDTADFLEEALAKLGLNQREANEFIVYWLPQMENNPYNIISFQTEAYTQGAELSIDPAPDTLIRVFMAWQPSENYVNLEPQMLNAPERTGFTVVEWGGAEITD